MRWGVREERASEMGVSTGNRASLLLLLLLWGNAGLAQNSVLDLRLLEVDGEGERTYHNLIFSHTFGESRFSLEAFALFLPQVDDYDEQGLGVGYRAARLGDVNLSLLAYLASAPDDEYLEPALLFVDPEGRFNWSLFVLRYEPLGEEGIGQWLIDPAELQFRVGGPVSVGLSAYLYRPDGGEWLRKIGPKISIADRLGSTDLAVRDVDPTDSYEIQLRRIFVW